MKGISTRGAAWDSLFLTLVKVITILSSMIQTKLLSVALSLELYGTYSQANIVISMGTSVILLGFGDAINYYYNSDGSCEKKADKYRIINTIFFLEYLAGFSLIAVIIGARSRIASFFSNEALQVLLPIIAAKPMLENLMYFYQLLYLSTGRAKTIAIRNLAVAVLKTILVYIAVYFFKNIGLILGLIVLLDVLQLCFFKIHFSRCEFQIHPGKISAAHIKPILSYSLPMGIFGITNILSRELDKLVVGNLTNTATLAIYTNCSKILPFDILVTSFSTVLIPYIMRYVSGNKKEAATNLFSNYIKIGYYSVWILGTAVLITSGQVISMLYDADYLAGKSVFVIYVLDSMLKFASMHLLLTSGGKTKAIMLYSFFSLAINLPLNVVFYHLFGLPGPAMATLIASAIYTYLILRSSIKLLNIKWTNVFDLKDMGSFLLTLAGTGIGFCYINNVLLDSGWNQYAAMILNAGGFCIINLAIHFKRIRNVLKEVNQLRI